MPDGSPETAPRRGPDRGTLAGIGVALVALLGSVVIEGGDPMGFLVVPAWLLILGGTFGVTMASSGIEGMLAIPGLYRIAFLGAPPDRPTAVRQLVRMAERARREGLLALEEEAALVDDAFLRDGIALVVDGTDPELVKDILDLEVEAMAGRHFERATIFTHASGFAPTIGVLGTVMGLVHVLENLSDPASLGPLIAGAFIATLIGVGSANVVYLPVANKLRELSAAEADARTMMIEGILSIQGGDNPRIVERKLLTYLSPRERAAFAARPAVELAAAA